MMLMQQIDLIKSEATLAFRRMERLAPTGRDDCEFEEALWQLEKVKDSVTGMYAVLDDFVCEAKLAMKALEKVGEVIQTKADNPYKQAVFMSFDESPRHAYS
jgi:hypothetical protein